jgi:hypothetical protein
VTAPPKRRHNVALWAGVSAFFGNIVALQIIEIVNGGDWLKFGGAVVSSLLVAGAVYSRERLNDAKHGNGSAPPGPVEAAHPDG